MCAASTGYASRTEACRSLALLLIIAFYVHFNLLIK
jgi:hypothetical protein